MKSLLIAIQTESEPLRLGVSYQWCLSRQQFARAAPNRSPWKHAERPEVEQSQSKAVCVMPSPPYVAQLQCVRA